MYNYLYIDTIHLSTRFFAQSIIFTMDLPIPVIITHVTLIFMYNIVIVSIKS